MKIDRRPCFRGTAGQMVWAQGAAVYGQRGLVLLSGSDGADPETNIVVEGRYAQTKVALEDIKKSLEDFGTSLENICHIWYYVVGPFTEDGKRVGLYLKWEEHAKALEEFWAENCPEFCGDKNPPAATLLGVEALATPEMLIEILVIAAIP